MNAMTPPKLMPPFQSTAANGTLPTEQTNETIATIGPTIGPQIFAATGCETRKNFCQKSGGTHAASAPALSTPMARSVHTCGHTITQRQTAAIDRTLRALD